MNKTKRILIVIIAAVLLALAVWLVFGGQNAPADDVSVSGNVTDSGTQNDPVASAGEADSTPDSAAAQTTPGESASAQSNSQTGNASGNTADSSASAAESTAKPTVSMGVVEGAPDGGITEEDWEDDASSAPQTGSSSGESSSAESNSSGSSASLPVESDGSINMSKLTYENYNAMSGDMQKKVIDAFATPEDFVIWYRAVEEKYKKEHPDIEIGTDGSIDAGQLG